MSVSVSVSVARAQSLSLVLALAALYCALCLPSIHAISQCVKTLKANVIYRDQMTSGPYWNPDFEMPTYGWSYVSPQNYTFPWGTNNFCMGDRPTGCPMNCTNADGSVPTACKYVTGFQPGQVQPVLGSDSVPVYRNNAPYGGVHTIFGNQTFWSWYHDIPFGSDLHRKQGHPPNCRINAQLPLSRVGTTDMFTYATQAFFPINGQCWDNITYLRTTTGNPTAPSQTLNSQNFGFTSEISGSFRFKGTETFIFCGDDDVFVYINGRLAIDIGGIHGSICRALNFTEMDNNGYVTPYECSAFPCAKSTLKTGERVQVGPLYIGTVYQMRMFHAERHTTASWFTLTTSLELNADSIANNEAGLIVPGRVYLDVRKPSITNPTVIGNSTIISAIMNTPAETNWTLICQPLYGIIQPFNFTWNACSNMTSSVIINMTHNQTLLNSLIAQGIGEDTISCINTAPQYLSNGNYNVYSNYNPYIFISFYRFTPVIGIQTNNITLPQQIVYLDASQTNDVDSSFLTYQWIQISGPSATFDDATSITPFVTLSDIGIYTFQLDVSDLDNNTATQQVAVTLSAPTEPPTEPPTTLVPTTVIPTTVAPTTVAPTTLTPTTVTPTTVAPTTVTPTTSTPTTVTPTIINPTTITPTTTVAPATVTPTTTAPPTSSTTSTPTTVAPTTIAPTTPTNPNPTTHLPTTGTPTSTNAPTTTTPTSTTSPTTMIPTTTTSPTTSAPTTTTTPPTSTPTVTSSPTTRAPTTASPTTPTSATTTTPPTPTPTPTPITPETNSPTTLAPTTTPSPTTQAPTDVPTNDPTTALPSTPTPTTPTSTTGSSTPPTSPESTSSLPSDTSSSSSSTGSSDTSSSSSSSSSSTGDSDGMGGSTPIPTTPPDNNLGDRQETGHPSSSNNFPWILVLSIAGGSLILLMLVTAVILKYRAKHAATRARVYTDSTMGTTSPDEMANYRDSPLVAHQAFVDTASPLQLNPPGDTRV